MLSHIFLPKVIDNQFRGRRVALYTFFGITALTLWRSQHHLLAADGGAQSIASVPLDQFSQLGGEAVISAFALWGLSQLIIGIIYLVAAIRYRSLIPFLYVLLLFEYLMRWWYIGGFKPMPTLETAPGEVGNYVFIVLSMVMIVLCIPRNRSKTE